MADFADVLSRSLQGVMAGRQGDRQLDIQADAEERLRQAQELANEISKYGFNEKQALDMARRALVKGAVPKAGGLPLSPVSNAAIDQESELKRDWLAAGGDPTMLPALTGAMSVEDFAKAARVAADLEPGAGALLSAGMQMRAQDLAHQLGLGQMNLEIYKEWPETQRLLAQLPPEEQAAANADPMRLMRIVSLGRSTTRYQSETARMAVVAQMQAARASAYSDWLSASAKSQDFKPVVDYLNNIRTNSSEILKVIQSGEAESMGPAYMESLMNQLHANNAALQRGDTFMGQLLGLQPNPATPGYQTSLPPEPPGPLDRLFSWLGTNYGGAGGGGGMDLDAAIDAFARGQDPTQIQMGGGAPPPPTDMSVGPPAALPLAPPAAEPDMSVGAPATDFALPTPPSASQALAFIPTKVKLFGGLAPEFIPWVQETIRPIFLQVATPQEVTRAQGIQDPASQAEYILSVVRAHNTEARGR